MKITVRCRPRADGTYTAQFNIDNVRKCVGATREEAIGRLVMKHGRQVQITVEAGKNAPKKETAE